MTYKLFSMDGGAPTMVIRLSDKVYIPIVSDNTDYQQFKQDVLEDAELQNADGNVLTQEEAVAFINELP